MLKIGFIGLGVMGSSIAQHILQSGYDLTVYNRTASSADPLIQQGAHWAESPNALVQQCDIVFTMVGFPSDIRQLYFEQNGGMLSQAKPKTIFVDMTTSEPSLAIELQEKAQQLNCFSLDAPVTGGDIGAKSGSLTMFVGGDQNSYETVLPILQCFTKEARWMGDAGSGQHTKMCNQIAIAAGMLSVCEAIRYAQASGLDAQTVVELISQGAAGSWSLSNYGPRILNNDFAPGFFIKHFIKDMNIALQEAERMNLQLPGLELAKKLYDELAVQGFDNEGIQALYFWYSKMS